MILTLNQPASSYTWSQTVSEVELDCIFFLLEARLLCFLLGTRLLVSEVESVYLFFFYLDPESFVLLRLIRIFANDYKHP